MNVKSRLKNPLAKLGALILIIGAGPLFVFILLDLLGFPVTNNPIGLGLLFVFTAPLGALLLVGGLVAGSPRDEPQQVASRYRIDPTLIAKVTEIQRTKLTAEDELYIDGSSIGAAWGVFYFVFLGVPGTFFRHLPANFIYTNTIKRGRRQAWEAKSWGSFDEFKKLNDQADKSAFVILAIGIPIVAFLMFM